METEKIYLINDCMGDENLRFKIINLNELKKKYNLNEDEEDLAESIEEEIELNNYENYTQIPKSQSNIEVLEKILKFLKK